MNRQKRTFFSIFSVLSALFCSVHAEASDYHIPPSIRFTLDRESSASPIIYYFSHPDTPGVTYPILILCEGSSSQGDLGSVFFIRNYFTKRIEPLHVGYLTIEKWGIDGDQINEEEFWSHYTRSQRLEDHLKVIHHLEQNPPEGWNGKLIFIGVSEGGPLVTDLSIACKNTIATINWVGAGDWGWADELWKFFECLKQDPLWVKKQPPLDSLDTPFPETREEFDVLVNYIKTHPTVDHRMAGMPYLYLADAFQRPSAQYSKIWAPFLVVEGTKDSTIDSCDLFVQKAQDAGAPITYFRVDGMDHYIRKRPDVIDRSFEWLKQQL